jgi:hypothetical protein
MPHRLAIAAAIALLGAMPDAGPVLAQFSQPQASGERSVPAALGHHQQQERYDTRANRHARRKQHAFRPIPNQRKIAERNGYKRVSDLVNFPKFFPGLGIIFVKPETLPLGPFLCFDRNDRLIATVYMVPIKEMDDHKSFEAPGFAGRADHVSIYFNAGHPGVDVPHYHFVIWHVNKKEEARVAK